MCSKLSEQIPIMKPKRLKDIQDNKSINSIRKGYSSLISTKKVDVIKIMTPRKNDFVVAAPTKPITISTYDIGADKNSYVVPKNFGKKIPKDEFVTLCIETVNRIKPGTMNAPYGMSLMKFIFLPIAVPKTIK